MKFSFIISLIIITISSCKQVSQTTKNQEKEQLIEMEDPLSFNDTVFIRYDSNGFDTLTNYKTDTLLYENANFRKVLTGTTALHGTKNQASLWAYGLQLSSVSFTKHKTIREGNTFIKSIIQSDTTLVIKTNIYENCCFSFLCDALIDSSGTLNLIYYDYGGICSCYSKSTLTYYFKKRYNMSGPKKEINSIVLNNKSKTRKLLD